MQIEFIGAPTAGKSTTRRALIEAGLHRPLPAEETSTPCHELVRERVRFPLLKEKALHSLDQAIVHAASTQWHVVDEGPMQFGVSIAIRQEWEWYVEAAPKPHILVHLDCKSNIIRERNAERESDKFPKSKRALKRIPDILDRLEGIKILTYRSYSILLTPDRHRTPSYKVSV